VELKVNDNIIIPVPSADRGPMNCRNIRGIIVDKTVNGYKIGTTVRVISGLLSRYQIEKIHGHEIPLISFYLMASFLLFGSVVQIGLFS
jgi:hypothetical protein